MTSTISNFARVLRRALFLTICATTSLTASAGDRGALQVPLAEMAPLAAVTRAGESLVAVGDYGVILTSVDGQKWQQARVPVDTLLTAVTFIDAKQGWTVGHGGVVLHSNDGGQNWQVQSRIEGGPVLLDVWFENATHGIAVGAYGNAFDTKDGGQSWQKIKVGAGRDGDLHLNAILADQEGRLFLAAESGGVFRSSDHGATWTRLVTGFNGSLWNGLVRKDGTVLLFGMSGRVLASRDHGVTWTSIASGTQEALTGGAELADGRVVLVGNGGVMSISHRGTLGFAATVRPDRQNLSALIGERAGNGLILLGQQGVKRQTLDP